MANDAALVGPNGGEVGPGGGEVGPQFGAINNTDNLTVTDSVTLFGPTSLATGRLGSGHGKLGLQVFEDSTKAVMIADWTSRARNVIVETGPHGYATLSAIAPMPTVEAFRFYDSTVAAHVVLSDGVVIAFEGRMEDRPTQPGAFEFTGFGYFRSMWDVVYRSLWSTTRFNKWRVTTVDDLAKRVPEKYHTDSNGRLYMTLRKGETYTDNDDICSWYYETSHNSDNDITYLTFDYDMTLPTDWELNIGSFTWGFGSPVAEGTVWTSVADANKTGSHTEAITASKQMVAIEISNQTGVDEGPIAEETDDWYVKITNVRVLTGSSSTEVYGDEIVDDLISSTNTVNSNQINSSTALVNSPAVDLDEAEYLDVYPGDILNDLVGIGDDSTPPEYYEWGVWEDQKLHYRQRGSEAQEWYIDLADFRVDSTLDTLRNSAYGLYTNAANKAKRTTISDDAASQSKYGITRRGYVRANDTTSNATTETYRDAYLEDLQDITPRAQIRTMRVFTSAGASVPVYLPRAGDNVTVRNLPPTGGSAESKIRHFRIHRTRLDCGTGELTIIPELEPPSLVDMVAANAKATGV